MCDSIHVVVMDRDEFEEVVGLALDRVPAQFLDMLENVVFLVEEEPPPDLEGCLGVYEGTPKTERSAWGDPAFPDLITIFMGPTLRACDSRQDVTGEVAVSVVHEIAHYFGIDDDRLAELGWD